jgi:hypothetical protein
MLKELFKRLRKKPEILANQRQEIFENQDKYPILIRQQIDKVFEKFPYDWWDHLPSEMSVLAPPDNRYGTREENGGITTTMGHDCEDFILHKNGVIDSLLDSFPEVDDPEKGDIVLYVLISKYGKSVQHIGKYDESGCVISRWGEGGPVLRHPALFVPTDFGNSVLFRRISEKAIREFQKLPDPDYI